MSRPQWIKGESCWSLTEHDPQLSEVLTRSGVPIADLLDALATGFNPPQSLSPFDDGLRIRPYRHLRVFYQRSPDYSGVLAIKGCEPHLPELGHSFDQMMSYRVHFPSRGKSLFNALDHFPIVEQKAPMALLFNEAKEDIHVAHRWQRCHYDNFGELALAPLPLMLLRWSDSVVESYRRQLMGRLSPRAKQIVEMILKEGLGAVVYYYPTVPIRVAHLDNELGDGAPASFRARLDSLQRGEINPSPTIEKWIDQVARMLATGFLPGSIDSIGVGHCLEAQNAVIDGGFVDLGSMVPMTEVIDDNRFHECLMAACCDLAKTIRTFLLGGQEEALAEYRNPSLTMAAIITRVTTDLQRRLEVYAGTISIDPRLTVFYEQCNSWEYYQKMLTALHPSHEGSQHA